MSNTAQINGISPWMAGASSPTWTITLQQGSDGLLNLTGVLVSQVSLYIYSVTNAASSNPVYTKIANGAGVFAIGTPTTSGVVTYVPAASDSATLLGPYAVRIVVNFNSTNLWASDYVAWTVQA